MINLNTLKNFLNNKKNDYINYINKIKFNILKINNKRFLNNEKYNYIKSEYIRKLNKIKKY